MTALRTTVKALLQNKEYDRVLDLERRNTRVVRTLVSLLYDAEEIVRWRAVTMMGWLAVAVPEKVRPLVSRFIWWMNDESGGIGWSSAPVLGEIGRRAPDILRDAVRVVVHYRQEKILLEGVVWAIGRLARTYPAEVAEVVPELLEFLADTDGVIRGRTAWALGEIGDARARAGLEGLLEDRCRLRLYEEEELVSKDVGTISAEALQKISAG